MFAVGNFEDIKDFVTDLTDNGKCTGCGACCSNLLPLSKQEVIRIKSYVKRHKIKECRHAAPFSKSVLDMTCPFLDHTRGEKKCTVYPVRGRICRYFKCNDPRGAERHPDMYKEKAELVDMRETFFGGSAAWT